MAGRLCRICLDNKLLKEAAKLVAQGNLSDPEIAARLGLPGEAGRMTVSRHRRNHIEKIARQLAVAASKGRDNTEKREQLVQAAQSGDAVQAFIGLEQITRDLRLVSERLERSARASEEAGSASGVAALSGQAIRSIETRAKLGNVGGFSAQRAAGGGEQPMFQVNFMFQGEGRRPERVEMSATSIVEHEAQPVAGVPVMRRADRVIPAPVDDDEDDSWSGEEDV